MILIVWVIIALVAIYLGYEFGRIRVLDRKEILIEANTRRFERNEGRISILVVGDSTAAGVGADRPEGSVPGRLSMLLDASIENYSVSGAVVSEIAQQFESAQRERYDMILIQAGANDVLQFKSLDAAERTMDVLLKATRAKSARVILLTAGRIGDAPLLPRVTGPLFNRRTKTLREKFIRLAKRYDAQYVDLYGAASDSFGADPKKYYAADMFHPSGDGYGIWFEEVQKVIDANWPDLEHEAR